MHLPPWHRPGSSWHSSISVEWKTHTSYLKGLQKNYLRYHQVRHKILTRNQIYVLPSKITVMGLGRNPSPPGHSCLYSAEKRMHFCESEIVKRFTATITVLILLPQSFPSTISWDFSCWGFPGWNLRLQKLFYVYTTLFMYWRFIYAKSKHNGLCNKQDSHTDGFAKPMDFSTINNTTIQQHNACPVDDPV